MKNRNTAALLAILLGGLGLHRFYLDKPVSGVFYLLCCWTLIPAIIGFFEGLSFAFMSDSTFNRKYNTNSVAVPEKVLGHIVLREEPVSLDEKTCPDCAETVKAAAKKCRYCGHQFAA